MLGRATVFTILGLTLALPALASLLPLLVLLTPPRLRRGKEKGGGIPDVAIQPSSLDSIPVELLWTVAMATHLLTVQAKANPILAPVVGSIAASVVLWLMPAIVLRGVGVVVGFIMLA